MGCSIPTALKRENEKDKESSRERERGREQCVDKGQRNNSLMVIGDGWNNHGSRLTGLNIGLM